MIVHLVTDRRRLCGDAAWPEARRCLLRQAEFAVAAGVDAVQVREHALPVRDLLALVREMVVLAEGSATRILVNDRLDVALAAGAHGVHLGARALPVDLVSRDVPEGFLVGCSVHSLEEAAEAGAADYLVAGTVWESLSKSAGHQLLGAEGLAGIARSSARPVLAIGGITVERVHDVLRAGAAGVAAIGLFVGGPGPGCRAVPLGPTVADMRRRFDTPGSPS